MMKKRKAFFFITETKSPIIMLYVSYTIIMIAFFNFSVWKRGLKNKTTLKITEAASIWNGGMNVIESRYGSCYDITTGTLTISILHGIGQMSVDCRI